MGVRQTSTDLGAQGVVSLPRDPQAKGSCHFMYLGIGKERGVRARRRKVLSCRGGKDLSIGDLGRGVQENLHPGRPLKIPLHGGSWALISMKARLARGLSSIFDDNSSKIAMRSCAPNPVWGPRLPSTPRDLPGQAF